MITVPVALGERSYDIQLAAGALDRVGTLIAPHLVGKKILVVADETVARLHGARLESSLQAAGLTVSIATFPAGELSKTVSTAERLWQACANAKIDRSDTIIAFGGGVSGDLAGYVAACWMRGVRFVQIPTTLLAMVDSSVGGKTGVNSAAGKNLVGAFKQPVAVVIDPTLVSTMDPREYRAGLAEVLKYGVIRDPVFFAWQETFATELERGDADAVAHAVAESCKLKAWYVAEDETEQGVRAHLNDGHTFGHALERETNYTRFLHGEAISIGMTMAGQLALRLELWPSQCQKRQTALLSKFQLPISFSEIAGSKLIEAMQLDKKTEHGKLNFILPTRIGSVRTVSNCEYHDILGAILGNAT